MAPNLTPVCVEAVVWVDLDAPGVATNLAGHVALKLGGDDIVLSAETCADVSTLKLRFAETLDAAREMLVVIAGAVQGGAERGRTVTALHRVVDLLDLPA